MYWRKLFVFLLLFQVACSSISRTPVSATDLQDPQVPGIEGARYWADVAPANISELLETALRQRQASGVSSDYTLTLSGGAKMEPSPPVFCPRGAKPVLVQNLWQSPGFPQVRWLRPLHS